jgi:hypothetical protein
MRKPNSIGFIQMNGFLKEHYLLTALIVAVPALEQVSAMFEEKGKEIGRR